MVCLTDMTSHERVCRSFFLCERWLAVEQDDGLIERVLPVAGVKDLTAFNHLFSSSVREWLNDPSSFREWLNDPSSVREWLIDPSTVCA